MKTHAMQWLSGKSTTFSLLCGEKVTRAEVLNVHLAMVAMLLMGALVNSLGTIF